MRIGKVDVVTAGKQIFKQTLMQDDVTGLSAELAYRFFLALFPFFIFLGGLGSFIAQWFNVQNPAKQLVSMMGDALPPQASQVVESQLQGIVGQQHPGALSLGIVFALFFATGGTNAVVKALNRAYDVPETRPFWQRYLVGLGVTLMAGSFIIGGFVLLIVAQIWGTALAASVGLQGIYSTLLNLALWPAAFLLILIATALIYWWAPNMNESFKWVSPGAVVFLVGWIIATSIFGYYVGNYGSYANTFGALAGVAVLMIWFYISAFALLTGAEVNAVVDEQSDPARVADQRRKKQEQAKQQQAKKGGQNKEPERQQPEDGQRQESKDRRAA